MNENLMQKTLNCELCIIGGGLSGAFAALAAARAGRKVILMQDRAMLGGNASSEIRMWVRGAKGKYDRETGYISELEERNIHGNPTLVHSLFDATLYAMLKENENITLLLNTSCLDAKCENDKIVSVTGWQTTTYTYYTVYADIFMDCSGDSILAPLVNAEYRHGREGSDEYGESLAPKNADEKTMGMSILLAARETDHPVRFTPPPFAKVFESDECFASNVGQSANTLVRDHKIGTSGANLWWVELGGDGDSIHDADRIRDELIAAIYGVWDHIKNRGDHGMENWELEWVGFLPGKRESRRYVGDYVMNEHDVMTGGHFEDEVAFGGWPMDDHNPLGMKQTGGVNVPSVMIPLNEIYGIPVRCLYSKNVENLMFAGRNISVTHAALSSTRVMGTCALIGQAAGTAAAVALKYGLMPKEVAKNHYKEVQKILMDEGVFLPHIKRKPSELTLEAKMNISDVEREVLLNGIERPRDDEHENGIYQDIGDMLTLSFAEKKHIGKLRLRFDPDFERTSISDNKKMRVYAMKLHTGKDFVPVRVAATIVKEFAVFADGEEIAHIENNYLSLIKLPLDVEAKEISVKWIATNGAERVHLFSVDLI